MVSGSQITEDIKKRLSEKFGEEEFSAAMERARIRADLMKVLRARRIECNMDQTELAALLNTNQQQISRYESGENNLSVDRLLVYAKALNLEIEIKDKDDDRVLITV